MDARRADALVDLILGRRGIPGAAPLIHVTVPADTLLGTAEHPGELAGHGPIPPALARAIAARGDATWQRILTDPESGTVRDLGRTRYRPPAALAALIKARDGTCRFPTCRQPAHRCDIDHVTPYPEGTTSEGNLASLSRSHHLRKTFQGWKTKLLEDGTLRWTTPTGHTYDDPPRRLHPPDTPPEAQQAQAQQTPAQRAQAQQTQAQRAEPPPAEPQAS